MFDRIVAKFVINQAKDDPKAFLNWLSEHLSPKEMTTLLAEATARYYAGSARQLGWHLKTVVTPSPMEWVPLSNTNYESPTFNDRIHTTARPEDSPDS